MHKIDVFLVSRLWRYVVVSESVYSWPVRFVSAEGSGPRRARYEYIATVGDDSVKTDNTEF